MTTTRHKGRKYLTPTITQFEILYENIFGMTTSPGSVRASVNSNQTDEWGTSAAAYRNNLWD